MRKDGEMPPICRYFLQNACRKGKNCPFSHDRSQSQPPSNVCRFYLQGNCSYGSRCRYDHVRPKALKANRSAGSEKSTTTTTTAAAAAAAATTTTTTTTTAANVCLLRRPNDAALRPEQVPVRRANTAEDGTKDLTTGISGASVLTATEAAKTATASPPQAWTSTASSSSHLFKDAAPMSTPTPLLPGALAEEEEEEEEEEFKQWGQRRRQQQQQLPTTEMMSESESADLLCPFAAARGTCPFEDAGTCPYIHGEQCPCCQRLCLHPHYPETHASHIAACVDDLESRMKREAQRDQSQGVECSICLDVVLEKRDPKLRRFGLLENCTHAFCLTCIRSWRRTNSQGRKEVRGCPMCRVVSYFVTPSHVWVEDPEEKAGLIAGYKTKLKGIDCTHYRFGEGTCPFGDSCFYRHVDRYGRAPVVPSTGRARYRYHADSALLVVSTAAAGAAAEVNSTSHGQPQEPTTTNMVAERMQPVSLWDRIAASDPGLEARQV